MANITLKGDEFKTIGNLPELGNKAPDFSLTAGDLSLKSLFDYSGKNIM